MLMERKVIDAGFQGWKVCGLGVLVDKGPTLFNEDLFVFRQIFTRGKDAGGV